MVGYFKTLQTQELSCDVKIGELFIDQWFQGDLDLWHAQKTADVSRSRAVPPW